MTVNVTHATTASGVNNDNRQISVTAWNEGHVLTGTPSTLLSFDVGGAAESTLTVDTDTGLSANSDFNIPTQAAVKNYVDNSVALITQVPHANGLVSGGQVAWESGLTFRVSAASYYIAGTLYGSAEQTITLDAADATNDRIDVIALDTTGTVVKITGTAASAPSEPDFDPTTQLKLTFVYVSATATAPSGITVEDVYLENTEWTSATSGSGFNAASTNNPYAGTKCIEGTTVSSNAYVKLTRSSTLSLDSYAMLRLFIRSKAAWNSGRVLRLQFFAAGVAKGVAVTLASGYWGFDSSIISGYQFVGIPISQFVIPAGTLIDQLRITDSGGSIGFYIDNITLQSTSTSTSGTTSYLTETQGDARYLQRANNLSDISSASTARTNLGLAIGTNVQAYDADLAALAGLAGVQGDIIYRDASQWQRLAAGTSGKILQTNGAGANPTWVTPSAAGGGAAGTSFPGSPATGDRFFRTDRNIEYFYDGTRWLSTTLFSVPVCGSPTNVTSTPTNNGEIVHPHALTYDIYVEKALISAVVLGTATWSVTLNTEDGASDVTLATQGSITSSTRQSFSVAVNSVISNSIDVFYSTCTRSSGTANLNCQVSFTYRIVG